MDFIKDFLIQEEELDLWNITDSEGFAIWSLVRSRIAQAMIAKNNGFDCHSTHRTRSISQYVRQIPSFCKNFKFLLPGKYDGLFVTSAVYVIDGGQGRGLFDRLYHNYYRLFQNPLILQKSFQGKCIRYPEFENNIYPISMLDIISQIIKIFSPFYPLIFENLDNILESGISEIAQGLFDNNELKRIISNEMAHKKVLSIFYNKYVFPKISHKIAFVDDASYLGRNAVLTFLLHKANFNVIELQHGLISLEDYPYNYPISCVTNLNHPCRCYLPDYLLTYGEYWKEQISIPSEIIPVGNWLLNKMKSNYKENLPSKNTILVISQWTITDEAVRLAVDIASQLENYFIIFKTHPAEVLQNSHYKKMQSYRNITIVEKDDVYHLIAKSQIIIGFYSTVLVEAAAFPDKRIFFKEDAGFPSKIGLSFKDFSDLVKKINRPDSIISNNISDFFWEKDWETAVKGFFEDNLYGK